MQRKKYNRCDIPSVDNLKKALYFLNFRSVSLLEKKELEQGTLCSEQTHLVASLKGEGNNKTQV